MLSVVFIVVRVVIQLVHINVGIIVYLNPPEPKVFV